MKVLVIGENCNDVFVYCKCDRISPEAPVPVLIPKNTAENKGMAENVKNNLESLDIKVDFITQTKKILKTRYVEDSLNHQIVRIDEENDIDRVKKSKLDKIKWEKYSAVVISDYDKGFLTKEDIQYILSKHKLTFVDTKKPIGKWCDKATFIKINEREYNYSENVNNLKNKLIVTLGKRGCMYKDKIYTIDEIEIGDVSGAGDTFLAGFVFDYLVNRNVEYAIETAQACAQEVIGEKGVTVIK